MIRHLYNLQSDHPDVSLSVGRRKLVFFNYYFYIKKFLIYFRITVDIQYYMFQVYYIVIKYLYAL